MTQPTLFDTPPDPASGKTCKTCVHIMRLQYPSRRAFFYCRRHASGLTENGMRKIRCGDDACSQYQEAR